MALDAFLNVFRRGLAPSEPSQAAYEPNKGKLQSRMLDVVQRTFDLGFTSFGGPPVHFRTLYRRFVSDAGGRVPWVDEQTVWTCHISLPSVDPEANVELVLYSTRSFLR